MTRRLPLRLLISGVVLAVVLASASYWRFTTSGRERLLEELARDVNRVVPGNVVIREECLTELGETERETFLATISVGREVWNWDQVPVDEYEHLGTTGSGRDVRLYDTARELCIGTIYTRFWSRSSYSFSVVQSNVAGHDYISEFRWMGMRFVNTERLKVTGAY